MKVNPIVQQVVNRQHVATPDREVVEAIWRALSKEGRAPENRSTRKDFYRQAIHQHAKNRDLYVSVMSGRL